MWDIISSHTTDELPLPQTDQNFRESSILRYVTDFTGTESLSSTTPTPNNHHITYTVGCVPITIIWSRQSADFKCVRWNNKTTLFYGMQKTNPFLSNENKSYKGTAHMSLPLPCSINWQSVVCVQSTLLTYPCQTFK